MLIRPLLLALMLVGAAEPDVPARSFRDDAVAIEGLINSQYAYLERLPQGRLPLTPVLRREAEAVSNQKELLRYAERVLQLLADHHAITGSSFDDSWAVVPSFADLWIEKQGADFVITSVRAGSPAAVAGILPGARLVAVGSTSISDAVDSFWSDLGLEPDGERAAYAARVLAAGRRNRPRDITVQAGSGTSRRLQLPNLYRDVPDLPPVSVRQVGPDHVIVFNDSLGKQETIAAFDAAMAAVPPDRPLVLDLTNTASGGNSVVARAVLGWFVTRPSFYQIHNLPAEQRETGIPRQWVEQVLPRAGKYHPRMPIVRVGRWTGSMGEGIAIGFDAFGARVEGEPMAGLLGAIFDHALPHSGLVLKLPTERLMAVDGTPREAFQPIPR